MVYKLIFYGNLEKKLKKQHPEIKNRLTKLFDDLEKTPYSVGKVLCYLKGMLREVYVGKYRLYFVISERKETVEVIGFVAIIAYKHKDEQDKFLRGIGKDIQKIMEDCKQKLKNLVSLLL